LQSSTTTDCPIIKGKYIDKGESDNRDYKPQLSWYLFRNAAPWRETTDVLIDQNDNFLVITLWNGGQQIFSRTLKMDSNEFACAEGIVKIDTKEFVSREGALGKEWSLLGLVKSDGQLVVKNENGVVGTLFLIPFAGSGTSWYRFNATGE
jgi:hypothetical protein